MPSTQKLRVFLCHSSNDKPAVRELYQRLKAEVWIDPWLDEEKLYPGQDWDLEIEKAVEAADAVIVFLSNNSVTKEGYVQRELRFVLRIADYKPEGTVFIIPVRLDDCPMPRRMSIWQYVDYFPENRKDWVYQRLLGSLKVRAEKLGILTTITTAEKINQKNGSDKVNQIVKGLNAKIERENEEKTKKEREKLVKAVAELSRESSLPVEAPTNIEQNLQPRTINRKFLPFGIGGFVIVTAVSLILGSTYLFSDLLSPKEPTLTVTVPTEEPGVGSRLVSEKDGMTMVHVPAGEFEMGSEDGGNDEKPVHTVYLDAFWIDQTEVTNAMYAKCVQSGECGMPSSTKSFTRNSYYGNAEFDDYPVIYVSWNDARAFCEWGDRRLPTEAEWEKAASWNEESQTKMLYPWGDILDETFVNFCDKNCTFGWRNRDYDDNYKDTAPVGSYPAGQSFYGAYDMAGNVWELVKSLYKSYPYSGNDGREDLFAKGTRVLRGGSWYHSDEFIRSANRDKTDPAVTSNYFGFRCALSASE